jgi:hypothetical protein
MLVAILTSMTITALVMMLTFPKTPPGKWLHRILVEAPARFFEKLSWAKLGQVLIAFAIVMFLVSIGPEGIALLTAAGVDAAMLEVILAIWLVSVSSSLGTLWRTVMRIAANAARRAQLILAPRNRARSPRTRKLRPPRKSDDQVEPGWAFA